LKENKKGEILSTEKRGDCGGGGVWGIIEPEKGQCAIKSVETGNNLNNPNRLGKGCDKGSYESLKEEGNTINRKGGDNDAGILMENSNEGIQRTFENHQQLFTSSVVNRITTHKKDIGRAKKCFAESPTAKNGGVIIETGAYSRPEWKSQKIKRKGNLNNGSKFKKCKANAQPWESGNPKKLGPRERKTVKRRDWGLNQFEK